MDGIIIVTAIHTPIIHTLSLPFNTLIIVSIVTETIIAFI